MEVVAGVRVTAQFTLWSPHVASWPRPGAMATKHNTMVQQGEEHGPPLREGGKKSELEREEAWEYTVRVFGLC